MKGKNYIVKKVKYDFFNENGEQNFSKEFEVKLSLDPDCIEENYFIILNTCDFKTKEERAFYRIFDQKNNLFINNSRQLVYIINQKNNPIIMKNCTIYAKEIIDKLKEAEVKINDKLKEEKQNIIFDGDYFNELRIILRYLGENFEEDLFSEEFIKYEGIKYLISLIKISSGNIRCYSLMGLNKLLDFEVGYKYIEKIKKEIFEILITILIKNESPKTDYCILDILIKIIGNNTNNNELFFDVAENYQKISQKKIFTLIVYFLSYHNKEPILKKLSLIFINTLLSFCEPSNQKKVLIQLEEAGIYEVLEDVKKNKQKDIQEYLKIFQENKNRIIKCFSYEITNYIMQIKNLKNKNKIIEEELKKEKEKNEILNKKITELNKIINEKKKIKKEIDNTKEQHNVNNDNDYLRKIIELTEEIKELKLRFPFEISKDEKLIIIAFISDGESIHYSLLCKNTEYFSKLLNNFYKEYPEFRKTKNIFLNRGKNIIEYETLEFNNIKNNDIILLNLLNI